MFDISNSNRYFVLYICIYSFILLHPLQLLCPAVINIFKFCVQKSYGNKMYVHAGGISKVLVDWTVVHGDC